MSIPAQLTKHRQKPLSRAAQNENEGAVRILLGRKDVNPNTDGG